MLLTYDTKRNILQNFKPSNKGIHEHNKMRVDLEIVQCTQLVNYLVNLCFACIIEKID